MSVKITDNTIKIKNATAKQANVFLRLVTEEIQKISEPKTPKKTGMLRKNVIKSVLGLKASIKWRQKYSAKQESIQHKVYTTPGTGPHYAENAVRRVVSETPKIVKRAFI